MALVIEATDESGPCGLPVLSVAHYGEQSGDAMRDPEMCFELGLAGGAHLNPFYFRQDYLGIEQWSRTIVGDRYVYIPSLHEQHERFAKQWDKNLRDQGLYRSLRAADTTRLNLSLHGADRQACPLHNLMPCNRSRRAIMNTQTTTEYRNLPLTVLTESTTNPRRVFADTALKELADSIRAQGVLSPLLVRPLTEHGFEIFAGARRYRAAQMAEAATVPVRIVNLTDAEALAAALVENLIRADVHPMEEANGLRALLMLEEPKYTSEQLAAKIGKTPSFVASRVRLTELVPPVVEAFYAEEIGVE